MAEPLNVDALTPDDHLVTLRRMAKLFQQSGEWINKQGPTGIGNLRLKRAAAVRWLLAETAYPIEENTPR